MATGGRASDASEIEVGSIYPTRQELRAAAAKLADTCVTGVALSAMWGVEGVFPYVGSYIGGIGGKYGGPRTAKKTQIRLKLKQRRQVAGAPGPYPAKTGTMRIQPTAGLVGCVFFLILVLPDFGPKRVGCMKRFWPLPILFGLHASRGLC